MKLLTVAVPCYNSEAYMRKCIDTLLTGGERMEILIVDDGSTKDNTPAIADELAAAHPTIIRVIHQENKGHGGAVNTGMANAAGLYFKVVDSDDWVDTDALQVILSELEKITSAGEEVDVFFNNYVYEKEGAKKKRIMRYRVHFPKNRIFGWEDCRFFDPLHYFLMHSMIVRTAFLREIGLQLPEHTFYVDNLFAFIPFTKVKKMYYADVHLYRYYIGREGQSVNEDIMISRLDQQLRVNRTMIDVMGENEHLEGKQRKFLLHSLGIIMTVSTVLMLKSGTEEHLAEKERLWAYLKEKAPRSYKKIRHGIINRAVNLPGKQGRKISLRMYRLANKVYGFN